MRQLALPAILAFALSACTQAQIQRTQTRVADACQKDAVLQPLAAAMADQAGPAGHAAVAVDESLVHPGVVAYCGSVGGVSAPR